MADYDVGAVGLQTPPASAVIQAYRPAVLVRNNGVHDALAVGSLRIYSPAGLLIFTTALYSGVIAPGETKPAQAENYWTPLELGRYQVIAHVTCIYDQVSANDNLAPCFVQVIPGEPEPPSPVTPHASQHEEGGTDEMLVDGLHGRLTDGQTPLSHSDTHQAAGSDQLNVTGLPGILADGQPIADHHATHEDAGGDEMNVDDLHGVLHNLQKPQVHANEAHDPNYAQDPHGNSAHSPDFCPLDETTKVEPKYLGGKPANEGLFLRADQSWKQPTTATAIAARTIAKAHPLADYEALHGFIPAGMTEGASFRLHIWGLASSNDPKTVSCTIYARNRNAPGYVQISRAAAVVDSASGMAWYRLDALISLYHVGTPLRLRPSGHLSILHDSELATTSDLKVAPIGEQDSFTPDTELDTEISVTLTAADYDGSLLDGFIAAVSFGALT